jgi:hypothetical protein
MKQSRPYSLKCIFLGKVDFAFIGLCFFLCPRLIALCTILLGVQLYRYGRRIPARLTIPRACREKTLFRLAHMENRRGDPSHSSGVASPPQNKIKPAEQLRWFCLPECTFRYRMEMASRISILAYP